MQRYHAYRKLGELQDEMKQEKLNDVRTMLQNMDRTKDKSAQQKKSPLPATQPLPNPK